ncbi:hypothetical protein IWQ61_004903 [Dispira simplex]|nr:hypothetical protein IWQ61_004903 [Dispira simplex]
MVAPRFKLPHVSHNDQGWGPAQDESIQQFKDIPYAPYSKADKLGRVADWYDPDGTQSMGRDHRGRQQRRQDPYQAYGAGSSTVFVHHQEEDEASFSLVDSRAQAMKKTAARGQHPTQGGRGGRGGAGRGGFQRLGSQRGNFRGGRGGGGHGAGGFRRRFGWRDYDRPQRIRFATINVGEDWKLLEDIEFHRLAKLSYNVEQPTDVALCGQVNVYAKSYDRVNLRSEQPLRRSEYIYYDVTASEDPIMERLAHQGKARVFATDSVVTMLMCATRTVYPWDLVINRVGNKLYLDKRNGGPLDFVTVNENAHDQPIESNDKDNINSPSTLAVEATRVNHEFQMQAVDTQQRVDMPEGNPFHEADVKEPPASAAYRYRLFDLTTYRMVKEGADSDEDVEVEPADENCRMVIRTQLDAALSSGQDPHKLSYVSLHALNQFDVRAPGNGGALDWRKKLDSSRGAVVATETKNNSCKLARWALQGLISGADQVKFGYVVRQTPGDNKRHVILGTQSYKPQDLAKQANVNLQNSWGIIKAVVDFCLKLPEGKYVMVRDPNKALLQIYSVPSDTFEGDEDEEQSENPVEEK